MYKLLVFVAFLAIAQAATNVQRCRFNAGNLPTLTRIEGCTNPPCNLPQLQNAVIHMTFTAPRRLANMRTLATAYLNMGNLVVPVPYDMGAAANTCNFLTNTRCPVNQGTSINYTLRVMIEAFFPVGTTATIEFRIEDNGPVVCIAVPIRIVGPRAIASDDVNEETVNVVDELPMDA
ncbi:uncharacterized protein [Epargyreus clarus]|uniref:uncharacterized protein n=1 Tax=Epargyreus clarus TaxID=520877 RepID=UPI003C2C1F6F